MFARVQSAYEGVTHLGPGEPEATYDWYDYSTDSNSPGFQVLSNQGSRGP